MPETAECMLRWEKQMLYFIVNEKSRSGRGAQIWKEVQRELVKRGIHYRHYVTEHEGHATRLAVEICAKTDDDICLAVVGGATVPFREAYFLEVSETRFNTFK